MAEIKFCGLTRPEDAAEAAALGAAFAGVIFAGGPRLLSAARAHEVFAALGGSAVRRVGVFGDQTAAEILALARECALHVLQLAGKVGGEGRARLHTEFDGAIWSVIRVRPVDVGVPAAALEQFTGGAAAVVLDAAVGAKLGGTGVALDWEALAPDVATLRAQGRVVLAGGLRPENVTRAIAVLSPDVVDVSSGVERAPGIKDPQRMRAFAAAVRAHEV